MENLFSHLKTSDIIALFSLIVSTLVAIFSLIGWIISVKTKKKEKLEDDKRQEVVRRERNEFQRFQVEFNEYQQKIREIQFDIENRSDLIPYFHLNRTKSAIARDNKGQLYVKVYLTNVGRGTATNIVTCPVSRDADGNLIYFLDSNAPTSEITHSFHDYFSENFAVPNESIKLEVAEIANNKQQNYFLKFKIKFSDVIGRKYEQEFKFGYDNVYVKGINQNSTSNPPKLIKDIN